MSFGKHIANVILAENPEESKSWLRGFENGLERLDKAQKSICTNDPITLDNGKLYSHLVRDDISRHACDCLLAATFIANNCSADSPNRSEESGCLEKAVREATVQYLQKFLLKMKGVNLERLGGTLHQALIKAFMKLATDLCELLCMPTGVPEKWLTEIPTLFSTFANKLEETLEMHIPEKPSHSTVPEAVAVKVPAT